MKAGRTGRRALATAVAAVLALAGCGGSAGSAGEASKLEVGGELIADEQLFSAAKEEGSLVFYTGGSEHSEKAVTDAFTEATGIEVETIRLAPNKLAERVLSEVGAKKLGADVIRISGEDIIVSLAKAGTFQKTPLQAAVKTAAGDAIKDDGLYFSSFDRVYSFAFNNAVVPKGQEPKNWADLLDPKWRGKLGIVQVGAGGSTAALTRFQIDEIGDDFLKKYAANKPRIFDSSAGQTDALTRGEVSVSTMPVATGVGAIADGAPLTIAVPEEGAAGYPFYAGVGAQAPSPNAAKVFSAWLLSKDAQKIAVQQGDYPVRADVGTPKVGDQTFPAADSGWLYRTDAETSLKHVEEDAKRWRQIFGYTG
ncbi:ABC transporter substrate-binding protein [Nonomuraea sp. KM88]|uniref:ABC transporter substrate-binding protein n=1 Tax=Nonomuraea sp. KM88 TaxID=3457427 RepID=UPI003FCC5740